ncbi:MAG: hypothetical protein CL851_03310 [Crocinitomicaceae bacterium]|nr:hypothetical protein [Crocinitomicaceae bacterium]
MNKLFYLIFFFLPLLLFGQSKNNDPIVESSEFRKLRFGLYGQGSLGWLSPIDGKKYSQGPLGIGFGWGFDVEINFNTNTSLRTGINLSTFKAGLSYYNSDLTLAKETYFVLDASENYVNWDGNNPPDGDLYQLYNRKFKVNYVNIPVILKLKTNEIGYFTYYGEFGATLGFKTKALVDDEIKPLDYNQSDSSFSNSLNLNQKLYILDINADKSTQPIRIGLNLGAGAEYNLSGNTSIFFQLNWNYFINNLLTRPENEAFLREETSKGIFNAVDAKAIPGNIVLSFGVLF